MDSIQKPSRLQVRRPAASQIVISLLILALGWLGGRELSQVDQDLRLMYTEYTLGAVDIAHIMADVMRYRNTIIRALEAPTKKDFERITASLPELRARIQHSVDRYASASLRVSRSGRSEPTDLIAVRESLDQYFSAASKTDSLLTQIWQAPSSAQASDLRTQAEHFAADNAGPKVIQVSLALDRLLETVADVAKDMQEEGARAVRMTSSTLIVGSILIALLNLFLHRRPVQHPNSTHPTSSANANPPGSFPIETASLTAHSE